MPAATFQDNLKAYKSLKITPFEKKSNDVVTNAREFLNYLEQVDSSMKALDITDAAQKVKIFNLVEYKLSDAVKKGVKDELVADEGDDWKKFTKKLGIYFQTEKIQSSAQSRLKNIKQKPGQPAIDVKIEIEELWIEAGYGTGGEKDKHILQILLEALHDPEIKLQYQYSLMPNKTPLTIDQFLEVANVIALHKPKTSYHTTNKVQRGGGGKGRGGRRFNYSNRFRGQGQNSSQRCYNCNSNQHRAGDSSCPAIGQICRGCSKKGHFQAACRSSGQNSTSQGSGQSGFRGRSFRTGRGRKFGRGRKSFHSRKTTEGEEQASSSNPKSQGQGSSPSTNNSDEQRQLATLLAQSVHI